MIQLRIIPVNIIRASEVGFATLTAAMLPISAQAQPSSRATAPIFRQVNKEILVGSTSIQCTATGLNTCINRTAMRPLTAKEVELLMGANSSTHSSSHPYNSHGSCSAGGCNVTATPPNSDPPPSDPVTSNPPASGGGSPPNQTQQDKDIKCALAYASTTPNPNFKTNFTNLYGWSSKSSTTGLTLEHATTTTDNPPATIPTGGGEWLIDQATTWFDTSQPHTDIYVYAYRNPDDIIGTLAHEWYHQDNDVPGESAATEKANETKAQEAGNAAKAAYDADGGAKCN